MVRQRSFAALRIGMLLVLLRLSCAAAEEPVDQYGGLIRVVGHAAESFHLEQIGKRWWLVTPDGHGMFVRAVSKVDTADYGGSGGFLAYDGVYLQTAAGEISPNLHVASASTIRRDVVHPATGVTLRSKGDSLVFGSSRFRPNYTYFWLDALGKGGKIVWYYSTVNGWKPIEALGNPFKGEVLAAEKSYNLDVGNYMAPDAEGFGKWENPHANKITWWDMKRGFPADFEPIGLPNDAVRRYYLRAVVAREFTSPPVLNQLYERADLEELIARKYGPGDYLGKWAKAATQRLRGWGFNAAGQYSYQYVVRAGRSFGPPSRRADLGAGGLGDAQGPPLPRQEMSTLERRSRRRARISSTRASSPTFSIRPLRRGTWKWSGKNPWPKEAGRGR